MRILCLYVVDRKEMEETKETKETKEVEPLHCLIKVDHVAFWYRSAVEDALRFTASTVCLRTPEGSRHVINKQEDLAQIASQSYAQWSIVVITDPEYPLKSVWRLIASVHSMLPLSSEALLQDLFNKYQDPKEGDKIAQIQETLDDIKVTMHNNIQEILRRGENIDSLVVKSEKLKDSSKIFIQTAKRHNGCCKSF
jgi:synaptobrevin family protein YKT6